MDRISGLYRRGGIWWTRVWLAREGREWRESTQVRVEDDPAGRKARVVLRERLLKADAGAAVTQPSATYESVRALILRDFELNRKNLRSLKIRLLHLDAYFAGWRLKGVLGLGVSGDYAAARKEQGASNASINRELSVLRRMLVLGCRRGIVAMAPSFEKLKEAPPRAGYFEAEDLRRVLSHLPDYLRPVMQVAYMTGWRTPSEILTRRREHVDLGARPGWLRIEPGEGKSGQARIFPLIGPLRALIEAQLERGRDLEAKSGRPVPWLFFHADGRRIAPNFYGVWHTACRAAGMPDRIPHDFRRTAYRNLLRAGVPEPIVMAWVGHESRAMADRYRIIEVNLASEFALRLGDLYAGVFAQLPHSGEPALAGPSEKASEFTGEIGGGERIRTAASRFCRPQDASIRDSTAGANRSNFGPNARIAASTEQHPAAPDSHIFSHSGRAPSPHECAADLATAYWRVLALARVGEREV